MAQDIIGRAWIGVGIRDETGPGLDRIERGLRQRRSSGMGTGGFGAGRPGGRESGAFGGWNQLAFGIEDAVVSAQLNGWQGAMRASANNITMLSLAFGGLRAQMLATAFVVGAQLLPAFFKMQGTLAPIATIMAGLKTSFAGVRSGLQTAFDRREIPRRVAGLDSSESARAQMEALQEKMRQIQAVDRPAAAMELATLRDMLAMSQRRDAVENWADQFGDFGATVFAGAETDDQRIKAIQDEIRAREALIKKLNDELLTLDEERGETLGRMEDLRTQEAAKEQQKARDSLAGSMRDVMGELSPLIGQNEAAMFESAERNRQLAEQFEKSGVDGSDLLLQLSQLDRLRLSGRGHSFRLPDTLDQFSVAGQKQFAMNQGTQNDPAIMVQQEIKREAQNIVRKLEELLDAITE